jgi:L-asparaginase
MILARSFRVCLETEHHGSISVVDRTGLELASAGDTKQLTHLRSTAKPFQLWPLILSNLNLELESADLALMLGSHAAEPRHMERLQALLARFGLRESHLQCGLPKHNCSGKHLAMLIVCQKKGWPVENYLDRQHPLQQWIHQIILDLSGASKEELLVGIDGCSAPTFILPLYKIAYLYAKLPYDLRVLFEAGMAEPEMTSGEKRFEAKLMRAFPGELFAKTGADGVFAMATHKFGIAFKIADGDASNQIRPLIAVNILRALQYQIPESLKAYDNRPLLNARELETGFLQAELNLLYRA